MRRSWLKRKGKKVSGVEGGDRDIRGSHPRCCRQTAGHVESDFLEVPTSYGGPCSLQGSLRRWKPIQMLPPPQVETSSGVIPSLMRPDCQLRAFNAEVTGSSTIALSPCSHSCPPLRQSLRLGMIRRAAVDGILPFLLRTPVCRGHDIPRRFLLVVLGLPQSFSDVFLLGWALRLIILNGPGHPDPLAPQLSFYCV